jgi:hypothetical protein
MDTILRGFAQFDNELRASRSRRGMVERVEQGYWTHRAPYGYARNRDAAGNPILLADPEAGPYVRQLFDLVGNKRYTQRAAAQLLKDKGMRQKNCSPFQPQTISKMLQQPLYAGRINSKLTEGVTIQAKFAPLIDPVLFDRVQAILAGTDRKGTKQKRDNEDFPLRNWVTCECCGKPLTASYTTSKGRRYPYYHCFWKECRGVNVAKKKMDEAFQEVLEDLTRRTTPVMALLGKIVRETWHSRHEEKRTELEMMDKQIRKLDTHIKRLTDLMIDGTLSADDYDERKAQANEGLCLLKCKRTDEFGEGLDIEAVLAAADYLFTNAWRIWTKLPLLEQRRFQTLLFPDGLAYSKKMGFGNPVSNPLVTYCDVLSDGCKEMAPHQVSGWETLCAWLGVLDGFRAVFDCSSPCCE